ncbi:acyl-CoA dehydrogenase family protein [Ramlibacter sp.]|uniref:acyl-CoA dehydrogenase family protein n=1 Tax=Ramlibacter sp. TaxID=1917967 RepID=UPI003D12BB33
MNFLTAEQEMWRENVHRFMEKEVGCEYVQRCDAAREYPYEAYRKVAEAGWLRMLIPEDQGGDGGAIFEYALMCEGLARYGFDFATAFMVSTFTAMNIVKYGTKAQQDRYLDAFMRGKLRFSISISEPSSGSDAASARTRATRTPDGWKIQGQKLWCSGAAAENVVIAMLVRSDPDAKKHSGLSMLLVPNDTPGVDIRKLPTMARRATGTTEIFLDGAIVPEENLLGVEGKGWEIIGSHLELERIAVAAAYVGNAQQAVTDALKYAHERIQFERKIYEFQAIKHMLADMQTAVDAARLLTYRAADMASNDQPCTREVSMAKLFASETLQTITRQGMQILGGHSMLPESNMERYFREGMQATIGGGTSQIQRNIISKTMGIR